MPTSLAAMLALFNDNTAGDISAADGRAVIQALYEWSGRGTVGADDAYWDGGDLADFTQILPSGANTLTEQNGVLSVAYSGQTTSDLAGILKPLTGFGIGDSIQTAVRVLTDGTNWAMTALVLADGNAGSSNAIMAFYEIGSAHEIVTRTGTMATVGADVQLKAAVIDSRGQFGTLHMRLTYQAANTFRLELSPDGVTWSTCGIADSSRTLTPTHGGIGWSIWGGTGPRINTYEYFKVNV